MTFTVDPEAIERVSALLQRNRERVPEITGYIDRHLAKGTAEQVGGQGLPAWFTFNHDDLVHRAEERLEWVSRVWHSAAVNFAASAADYRRTDRSVAANMDNQLPHTSHPPTPPTTPDRWPSHARTAASFQDVADPLDNLHHGPPSDVSGMQPKVAEIAKWIGNINDVVSMNWWLREVIKEMYGRDPIEEVLQIFSGDWQVFARYGHAWLSAGGAVSDLRSNIEYVDDALAWSWSGNAADNAIFYLQQLTDAMKLEKDFYDYLFDICKGYVEVAYWGYQILNYLVGELIDLALESIGIFTGLFSGGWGTIIDAIIAAADAVMFIVDFFRQLYHGWQLAAAVIGMPSVEPPSDLPKLLLSDPDPAGRNCIYIPVPR
ncbi:hypothetical protein [Micromonospora polyrhachis]|uniref:WXG100 family type VII secretion target n=1 Tax=Micromonospora polyrhachis TaxID=1282883 RepID=A0A7W7WQ64_9ACTN|nr:hypothetical protein [Micromonospora polyrhachis]MBB4959971.1 hypothetical protein [Micromonospora polyrhachis]